MGKLWTQFSNLDMLCMRSGKFAIFTNISLISPPSYWHGILFLRGTRNARERERHRARLNKKWLEPKWLRISAK